MADFLIYGIKNYNQTLYTSWRRNRYETYGDYRLVGQGNGAGTATYNMRGYSGFAIFFREYTAIDQVTFGGRPLETDVNSALILGNVDTPPGYMVGPAGQPATVFLPDIMRKMDGLAMTAAIAPDGTGESYGVILMKTGGRPTMTVGMRSAIQRGTARANRLRGDAGANALYGLAGNDTLDGGRGADLMDGGAGADTYIVDNRGDRVVEALATAAGGSDLVRATVSVTLSDNVESLRLEGRAALSGTGNDGDNQLTGNGAANTLRGMDGDDLLIGGGGADVLFGGAGSDSFRYTARTDGGDRLRDFQGGQDRLEFSRRAFGGLGLGALAADRFETIAGTGGATRSATRFFYNSSDRALYFDADGSGSRAAVRIATFTGRTTVSESAIFVV